MNRMRFFSLVALLALGLTAITHTAVAQDAQAPNAAATKTASDFINDVGVQAVGVAGDKKLSDTDKRKKLEALIDRAVDVEWVGKFVLGKYWRSATADQLKHYMESYRQFLMRNYTTRFMEYSGETFKVTGVRDEGNGKFNAVMEIVRPKAENVIIEYRIRMNEKTKTYRIFDIIVEGVSLVATQRSEFTSVVSREGIDYLTAQLKTKNVALPTKKE